MTNLTQFIETAETILKEIKEAQQQIESQKLFIDNITIRLAINQLRHGELDYKDSGDVWGKIRPLVDSKRLIVTHAGDIYLDHKPFSQTLLDHTQ